MTRRRPKVLEKSPQASLLRWPICGFWLSGQNVVSPRGEISSFPENVHFPSKNPSGTDTQFAAKRTPKNYLMYHSTPPSSSAPLIAFAISAKFPCVWSPSISGIPPSCCVLPLCAAFALLLPISLLPLPLAFTPLLPGRLPLEAGVGCLFRHYSVALFPHMRAAKFGEMLDLASGGP